MRAKAECVGCLEDLARRTAELAAADPVKKEEILNQGLAYLNQNFSCEQIPTRLAGEMQKIIRTAGKNKDPFATVKTKEMKIARELAEKTGFALESSLDALISFAARGNSIDFFLALENLREEMDKPVTLARDDTPGLYSLLKSFKQAGKRKTILYFADNAGECYFDLPLITALEEFADVIYIVKENPVQNDLTLKDLESSGIRDKFKNVITTGTDSPGLDLSLAPEGFYDVLAKADLLFAKGMGYYETLPELSLSGPVFLLLKAKCSPIAESLNVPLNSYVALMLKQ